MIPILLLDLAGVVLVIGYVLLDRRQDTSPDLSTSDTIDPSATPSAGASASRDASPGSPAALPIEPIIAQRPLPPHIEPRLVRRPQRAPASARQATPVSRSDEA